MTHLSSSFPPFVSLASCLPGEWTFLKSTYEIPLSYLLTGILWLEDFTWFSLLSQWADQHPFLSLELWSPQNYVTLTIGYISEEMAGFPSVWSSRVLVKGNTQDAVNRNGLGISLSFPSWRILGCIKVRWPQKISLPEPPYRCFLSILVCSPNWRTHSMLQTKDRHAPSCLGNLLW